MPENNNEHLSIDQVIELAEGYIYQEKIDEALHLLNEYEQNPMSDQQRVSMLFHYGTCYQYQGNYQEIIQHVQAAIPIAQKIGDIDHLINLKYLEGSAYHNLMKMDLAYDCFKMAWEILDSSNASLKSDLNLTYRIAKAFGIEAFQMLKYEESQQYLDLARELLKKMNDPNHELSLIGWMSALTCQYQGRWKEARKWMEWAEKNNNSQRNMIESTRLKIRHMDIIVEYLLNMAPRYNLKQLNEIEHTIRLLIDNSKTSEKSTYALALIVMAKYCRLTDRQPEHVEALETAEDIANAPNDALLICQIYTERGKMFGKMGKHDLAKYCYTHAIEESEKCGSLLYGLLAKRELMKYEEQDDS